MFNSARIKLTGYYLLIIMFISIFFSAVIYKVTTSELDRMEKAQRIRIERGIPEKPRIFLRINTDDVPKFLYLDPQLIQEAKNRIFAILAIINIGILGTSTALGYMLAGKTLKPIQQMIDEQNRFITDASHELRTPLTSLKSEIEVNLRDKNLKLESAKKLLKSNLEEVNNLQVLTDSLIKLSQYQNNTKPLNLSSSSLASAINQAIEKVSKLSKIKNIEIVNKVKNHTISADEFSLIELFVILLDNSIKYSPKNTKINLTSESLNGHIVIQIEDQGIGISKKDIPYVFNRFYRADKSRAKSQTQGYGLGLSIAKQITNSHKGSIKIESKQNIGTTITIEMPLKESAN